MRPSAGMMVPYHNGKIYQPKKRGERRREGGEKKKKNREETDVFNLENVTGYDKRRLDFLELAITKDDGLESESLLELLDDGTGLIFLHETDGGVEKKEGTDDTKVDPVLKTCGEDGGGLHDELNGADKVHEELEDEILLVLLHLIKAVLLAAGGDLGLGQTASGIGVEHILRHGLGAADLGGLLFLLIDAVDGLEIIDESVDVLVVIVADRVVIGGVGGVGGGGVFADVMRRTIIMVDLLGVMADLLRVMVVM